MKQQVPSKQLKLKKGNKFKTIENIFRGNFFISKGTIGIIIDFYIHRPNADPLIEANFPINKNGLNLILMVDYNSIELI
jgi:hypothetical protein